VDSVAVLFRPASDAHAVTAIAGAGDLDARIPARVALGSGVTGWVAANMRPIANADAELDLGEAAALANPPLRTCHSVPVLDGPDLVAVLTVYSPYAFSETQQLLIEALARALPATLVSASALEAPRRAMKPGTAAPSTGDAWPASSPATAFEGTLPAPGDLPVLSASTSC
jgi:GAF domain-containing protein